MDAAERNRKGDREIMAYNPKYSFFDSTLAQKDAEDAERMANAQSRLTQAEIKMAENRAVSTPRMMELRQEQARNGAMDDAFAAARQRRLDSQRMTAIADPGRYAPSVRQEALEWQRTGGLRAHELAMLDKQDKGMLDIQAEKTRTAGEAARQTGLTNIELEKLRGGYTDDKGVFHPGSQTLLEREKMQNGIDTLDRQLQQQERIANGEQQSRERVATITGQSAVQQQTEANKGLAAQAEINRQKQQEQIAAQIQRSIIAAGGKADAAKIAGHAKIVGEALRNGSMVGKDAATVMAELAEQYKNDPEMLASIQGYGGQQQPTGGGGAPKEGDRRETASGMAVFRNGKWVLETK